MWKKVKKIIFFFIKACGLLFCIFIISMIIVNIAKTPSNEKVWNLDQKILPTITIDGDIINIKNIRDFKYESVSKYTAQYYDKSYDLNKLKKVWYVVEPFEGVPGSAHTFLSFEFENDVFLAISVEIRKEIGEKFNPLKGLFANYELVYIIGDEKDLIKLRSNYRKNPVYLYPSTTEKEKAKELFLHMLARTKQLQEKPEFYNTVSNNCTTNIVSHINHVSPEKINSFYMQALFPEYSDELAYRLGFLNIQGNVNIPFENVRAEYLINEKALRFGDEENFSRKIREAVN